MVMAFWQPQQREVLLPFTWRYLEEVPKLAGGLMLKVGALINGMFPDVGDQAFLDAALAMAHADGTDPTVRSGPARAAATTWSGGCGPAASSTECARGTDVRRAPHDDKKRRVVATKEPRDDGVLDDREHHVLVDATAGDVGLAQLGGGDHDEVAAGDHDDQLAAEPPRLVRRLAVEVAGPPLVAVAES